MNRPKYHKTIKYGLVMGITLCVYTMIVFLLRLDRENLNIGEHVDRLVILVPMLFTFMGVRSVAKESEFTYWESLKSGLLLNLISFLIYTPFLILYHHFINPEWLEYLVKFTEEELLQKNASAETIKVSLEQVRKLSTDINHIASGLIFGVLVLGSVFSLISAFIVKRMHGNKSA